VNRLGAALAFAVLASACLSLGNSPLAPLDETAPTLLRLKPELREPGDAGVLELPVAGQIEITFSEQMDPSSLRAGISVRNKGLEVPLSIVAPDATPNPSDVDREMTVTVAAAGNQGFPLGVSRLVLKTLLIDQQGNTIVLEGEQPEVIYFFNIR
jgi:hypothetical protein